MWIFFLSNNWLFDKIFNTFVEFVKNNFYFNNKLYKYIRVCHVDDISNINHVMKKSIDKLIDNKSIISKLNFIKLSIIRSTTSSQSKSIEYVFRSWYYATIKMLFDLKKFIYFIDVWLNNDYIILIIDKQFFRKALSNCQIRTISIFVIIREIDVIQHVSSNYVMFDLWFFDHDFNDFVITHIIKKIYLINELRVNILINMNIQKIENIKINVSKRRFKIHNCARFSIAKIVVDVDKRVDRLIRIKKIIFLLFHLIINMLIQIRDNFCLSIDKNYIFHSKINLELKSKNNVYFHHVNVNIFMIQIRNIINKTYIISRHIKLNYVLDYEKKNCYMTTSKNAYLTIKLKKQIFKNSFKLILTKLVNVSMLIDELTLNLTTIINNVVFDIDVFNTTTKLIANRISLISEIITLRNIIIYKNELTRNQLKQIIDQFFTLWIDYNLSIDISKKKKLIDLTFNVKM